MTNTLADRFMEAIGVEEHVESQEKFSPDRFPFTYAHDYIRSCDGINSNSVSRQLVAHMLQAFIREEFPEVPDIVREAFYESLCVSLALRYMRQNGIEKP